MLSNCGHDSRGKYSGDTAGDQTGGEWAIINWYNRPWNYAIWHPNQAVNEKVAALAVAAAKNDLIGYDQSERMTFWNHLKASNYDPAQITVACETDCSCGVLSIVKAVGYLLGMDKLKNVNAGGYTGNERQILVNAGFEAHNETKYLTGESCVPNGAILLNEAHHTAIEVYLSNSAPSGSTTTEGGFNVSTLPTIKKGSKNAYVTSAQSIMCGKNCPCGNIDSDFGNKTDAAVRKWQSCHTADCGSVDGIVGPKTWASLLKD